MGYLEYRERLRHGNIHERALFVALRYGGHDGAHHKEWVIDQMVRRLAGSAYPEFVAAFEEDGAYRWPTGIAP